MTPQNQYDNNGNPNPKPSYSVSNTIQVTIRKVDQVEAVLTGAISAGANTIYNLSFGIQDTSALEQQARSQAVAQAQDRAQQLATALGITLGSPVSVSEVPQSSGPVPVFGRATVAMAAPSSQPVSSGQLGVTVQVEISFSIGS